MLGKLKTLLIENSSKTVLNKSILAFGIKAASAGLSFVMFVLLARVMGVAEYGAFGAVFSFATLMATLGSFGQRPLVLRFASAYDEVGSKDLLRGVFRHGYRFVIWGSLTFSLLIPAYYMSRGSISFAWGIGAIGLTVSIALAEFQALAFRASGSVSLALLPRDIIWRFVVCAICLGALYLDGEGSGASVAWLWLLWLTLSLTVVLQFWAHEKHRATPSLFGPVHYEKSVWKKPMRGLWVSSVVIAGTPAIAVLIIEQVLGPQQAGPFFSALRTAQLLNLLLIASTVICAPLLSRSLSTGHAAEAQKIITVAAFISGAFALCGVFFFIVFGKFVLGLFGVGFGLSYGPLLVLSFGFLINALAGPTGPLLEMSGHEKYYSKVLLIFNGLSICAMPFLIAVWGQYGAAISIAFAAAGWNIAAWFFCRRYIGIDPTLFALVLPAPSRAETNAIGASSK